VYPIKVNQQRVVVEEVYRGSADLGFGLEAGSKPELLAVMAMTGDAPSGSSSATASRTTATSRP
jgi:arginine decarboxylase